MIQFRTSHGRERRQGNKEEGQEAKSPEPTRGTEATSPVNRKQEGEKERPALEEEHRDFGVLG